jgi:hypothetical protein
VTQHNWTEDMLQEARQWSSGVKQEVQQFMIPCWTKLTVLWLDVEMDRGFLQAVADHCPHLEALACSTLSIKESQPQIKLPSLLALSLFFNLRGGCWHPNPVPVTSYAALSAPRLEEIYTVGKSSQRYYATVSHLQLCLYEGLTMLKSHKLSLLLVSSTSMSHWAHAGAGGSNRSPSSRDAEVAASGTLRATSHIILYTAPPGTYQPHPTAVLHALSWHPSSKKYLAPAPLTGPV